MTMPDHSFHSNTRIHQHFHPFSHLTTVLGNCDMSSCTANCSCTVPVEAARFTVVCFQLPPAEIVARQHLLEDVITLVMVVHLCIFCHFCVCRCTLCCWFCNHPPAQLRVKRSCSEWRARHLAACCSDLRVSIC